MRDAFFRSLSEYAATDKRVMFLTADLGYKLFDDFHKRFPGRFLNLGVSEANMISVAAGLAFEGKRPVTYSIVPFTTMRCLEQIRNDVCSMGLPVIVVGVGAGFAYGRDGFTHNGIDDLAVMRALPGMTVVSPCDPRETVNAFTALMDQNRPGYLRLGRAGEQILPGTDSVFKLGCPTLLRDGQAVALMACGTIAQEAIEAANRLKEFGIYPLVLSVHTVKPLGQIEEFLSSKKIKHIFTIEEHGPCGGLHEAISAHLAGSKESIRVEGIHTPDQSLSICGSTQFMRRITHLDAESICKQVLKSLGNTL